MMGARGRALARALLPIVAGVIAACGQGAPRRAGPPPRQALLILLDAARADRFSGYGYARDTTPRLDALGREGLVFTRCFAHATQTRSSLSSLFYSRYFALPLIPESARIPLLDPDDLFRTLDAEAISLPRALATAGITTAGVSAHSWIRSDSGLATEFDEFHDLSATLRYPPQRHYPSAEQVVDWLVEWLDAHRDGDFFAYVHLMDTHFPHLRGPDARHFFDGEPDTPALFDEQGRPRDTSAALSGGDRAHLDALYDGSLRFADRQLGRLLDHLAAAGRLEHMVILVTADHGEELLEQPERFGHGGPWRDVLGRVPLIVYAPGRVPAARVDGLVELVDVAPTMLALLGVGLPPGKRVDGVDVVAVARGERPATPYVVMPQGIRGERWKAQFPAASPLAVEAAPVELYDLAADPAELRDVAGAHPEEVAALTAAFRERLRAPWMRWQGAVATGPPQSPFAIAASQMRLTPAVPLVAGHPRFVDLASAAAASGWVQSTGGNRLRYALLARDGAAAVTLEFPVPDGEYRVHLGMRGACRVDVAGGPQGQVLRSAARDRAEPEGLQDVEAVDVGVVRVTDRRFQATVLPLPGVPWLLIRTVGFEPLGTPGVDAAAARAREERLRGLGYVE